MALDFKKLVKQHSHTPERTVRFGTDARRPRHLNDADPDDREIPSDFTLTIAYQPPRQVDRLLEGSLRRKLANARKGQKGYEFDADGAILEFLRAVVRGWSMTVGGLVALECPLQFANDDGTPIPDAEPVVFNDENLKFVASLTDLANIVQACLADFDFWFPRDKEQEGNSGSGLPSSSGSSPAETASSDTPSSMKHEPATQS